jgi:HEAT repeat protein
MSAFRYLLPALLAASLVTGARAQTPSAKTVEQWLSQLKDADAARRREAAVALGSQGPDLTKAAIQTLGQSLHDADLSVRHAAALSLGNLGPAAKAALPAIRGAVIGDASPAVRRAAVFAMGNMGPDAKPGVGELIRALGDSNETVRHASAYALGSIGEEAKTASAALGKALVSDPDADVRQSGLRAPPLRRICPGRDRSRGPRGGSCARAGPARSRLLGPLRCRAVAFDPRSRW